MGRFLRALKGESGIGQPPQVAAVCYRANGSSVEFLLVNTSSGKWTFPKGRLEAALSASESAAAEAWEEAGARGAIEDKPFGFYLDTKRPLGVSEIIREITVAAYLMEVHSAVVPQESGRNPSWFAPLEAKRRLSVSRTSRYSETLHRIVDAAIERISSAAGVAYSSKQHSMAHLR